MNKNYIPRKDADFNQWVINLMLYLADRYESFNIPAEIYQILVELHNKWSEKYGVAEAPSTRTKAAITEKEEARKALESELRRMLREFITYNRLVTDADRENMGLPVHKTSRTPVPAPVTVPELHLDTSIIRRLGVHFRNQGSKSNAKPDGVHGAEIRWGIADAQPATVDDLPHSAFDTRSPLTLEFADNQRGNTVYLCIRWESTRGDKGPWSDMFNAIIP